MRLMTAVKSFFVVLSNPEKAEKILSILNGRESLLPPTESASRQSDAITLLAALQREARFLDFIKENLDSYEDAQIGAAARSVHDKSAAVIERFFSVQPLRSEEELSKITIEKPDAAFVQFVGDISGEPPYSGRLAHHGWIAQKCDLPKWSGNPDAAFVLAPAEIEIE
ncbi:MAG: DUF2760 domain-containing protein [Planctomycetaceae bacterium]|jgi:hypothetical protein|nr:DUF2760 domain-containing protein [Planctomycetaceae bacterium]